MFTLPTQRKNVLRGVRISHQKKLEGIRLMNELADKVLTDKQKIIRRKLKEGSR